MDDLTDLLVSLGIDISGFRDGINNAVNVLRDGVSRITSNLDRISDIGGDLAKFGTILSASVTVPLVALGTASLNAYGEIQALQKGLEAVGGSATYAGKQFERLKEVAKLPGIGLPEAVKGSIGLQAIGFSAGNAEKILTQFGNAIATAGRGRVEFERAIYGVQQLANTEFPLGEDLNIIRDALPQVTTLLMEAFGTARTEDLQKMKVSSKEVVDVIVKGLEKLPRVSGGIKNSFENLKDSVQQNLSRIGERIDQAFDISGIINKLTNALDSVITYFEDLSPATQKVILVIAGLTAVAGPLILAVGGFLAALPILTAGFTALAGILPAVVSGFTTLAVVISVNPITALIAALAILSTAIYLYSTKASDAEKNQERLNDSLERAAISAKKENEELKKLYETSQDQTKSLEERTKAVDQLQKQYPAYFQNISDESILVGNASKTYKQLTIDITNASRARAAQAELDKRSASRLEEDLELQKKLTQSVKDYNNAQDRIISTENGEIFISAEKAREAALGRNKKFLQDRRDLAIQRKKEDDFLIKIIGQGNEAVAKLETIGANSFLPGLEKVKKETEKQLSEIFPIGSIAEIQQRADLLKKALETSVDGIVKVRGLDKFGKQTDKKGLPYFTGEILSLEEGFKRLEQLNAQIDLFEPKSPKTPDLTALQGFRDTLIDFSTVLKREGVTIGEEFFYLPEKIAFGIDKTKVELERLKKLTKELNKDFNELVTSSIANGLTDLFSGIGKAIGEGTNVISAIGNGLLSAFSGFLSDMGKMLIEYGTLAIAKGTLDLIIQTGGYQAIAAGIAAIAVGAALSIAGGALGSRANKGMNGNISSSAGTGSGNNYSGTYTNGGNLQGGDTVYLRLEGRDLVASFNRNVALDDRVNAG